MDHRLAILRDITAGFDSHDLGRILDHFADDASDARLVLRGVLLAVGSA